MHKVISKQLAVNHHSFVRKTIHKPEQQSENHQKKTKKDLNLGLFGPVMLNGIVYDSSIKNRLNRMSSLEDLPEKKYLLSYKKMAWQSEQLKHFKAAV